MRVISLKEVEEKKLLSKFSPIFLLAKRLSLKYIIQEGKIFTGPAVEMASLIDRITSKFEIKKVLDLCSGTGALAKICLINGCEKVTCVDLNIRVAERNLEEFGERVELVEKDVRDFEPKEFYDLVILDSPRELTLKLLRKNIPKFKRKCNLFVMWHGTTEETEWNELVRNELRKIFSKLVEFGCWGAEISCCSSTKKGMEWLEKLFKEW